jgi:CubicO group peptidase (beta-lactamase class C family)
MLAWIIASAHAGLVVDADPRIELLQALLRAAGAEEFQGPGAPAYTAGLDALLAQHADHRAVAGAAALRRRYGVGYNSAASLAVTLDADLRPVATPDDGRWHHRGPVRRWLRSVRRFRDDAGWDGFFAAQSGAMADQIDAVDAVLAAEDLPGWFAAAFGEEPEVRVHLSPLSGNNNFGASVAPDGGPRELHAVIGASGRWSPSSLRTLVHEVAHGYAGPVAKADAALVGAVADAWADVGDQMQASAYGEPEIVANETLTRAVTVLYLRDRHPTLVPAQLAADEAGGFGWSEAAADALAAHRDGPEAPLDLEAGAASVAEAVRTWTALAPEDRVPPFRGTVNAGVARVAAVVVPDPGAADAVTAYATEVFRLFAEPKGAALVAAGGLADWPDGGVIAYGSPESNAWIAKIAELARWRLGPDGVAVDGRWFPGAHLALIACWPHPTDPRDAVVAYAAADDADLVGINAVHHGPDDWQVVRRVGDRFETVAKGAFVRSVDGSWSLPSPPPRRRVDPASVGLDPAGVDALIARAVESRSDALLLWVDGTEVVRWPEVPEPIETMSMTKSIVSLGIGLLVASGEIPSIDAPASRWIGAWKRGDPSAITLRMLLEHTSGLEAIPSNRIYAAPDIVAQAAALPLTTSPGEAWAYNNAAANLVTAIGTAAAGVPFDQHVDERLLAPLGIPPRPWMRDPAGNVHGGAGLALTADDLLRIGRLMLDEGEWEGERLIPAEWVRDSTAPTPRSEVFGRQWWVSWRDGEIVGFRADGWLGQYLVVVPERRIVAVRQMRATPEIQERGAEGVDTFRDFQQRVLDLAATGVDP